jgi:hypothetical protein
MGKSSAHVIRALVMVAIAAPSVHAFDASGAWTGQYSCKLFNGTSSQVKSSSSTLAISQSGSAVIVSLDGAVSYAGYAIDDGKKGAAKGQMFLTRCGTDNLPAQGNAEILRAAVKASAAADAGTFTGFSALDADLGTGNGRQFGTCKYKYKRTSRTSPKLVGCM